MLNNILIGFGVILVVGLFSSILVHKYYFAWTDSFTKCMGKQAYSKRDAPNSGFVPQKFDYLSKVPFGYLNSSEFISQITDDPSYKVRFVSKERTEISRDFEGGEYTINFIYVWKTYDSTSPPSIYYDGVGITYSIIEKCGVPYSSMEKNLRQMIRELPVDQELAHQMNKQLALEFSTSRNLIKVGL